MFRYQSVNIIYIKWNKSIPKRYLIKCNSGCVTILIITRYTINVNLNKIIQIYINQLIYIVVQYRVS